MAAIMSRGDARVVGPGSLVDGGGDRATAEEEGQPMDARARADAIAAALSPVLAGSGVVIDSVVTHPAGRRRLVRVTVARDLSHLDPADETSPVEPLDLDEIAAATRTVSSAMDELAVMGEAAYTLEVSSPGVGQPLTSAEAFRRNVGRVVEVDLADDTTREGRIAAVGRDGIRLDDPAGQPIPFESVRRARVQVEFTRSDHGKES